MMQRTRWCVAVALIMTLVSPTALAARKGGKRKAPDKSGPNMDSADPAATEKSDEGPYAPKGATGPLAEKAATEEEVEEVLKARPRDKHVIFGDFVFGFGSAPAVGPASSDFNKTNDALSLGAVLGGTLDVSPKLTLGLRIPWSTAAVERTNGTARDSTMVFGSPEILAEYRTQLSELTTIPILVGLGLPLAQGNPDPSTDDLGAYSRAQVNMIADAASGWRDGELYAPKRIPVVLGIGIRHEMKKLELHAWTKLVAGINIGPALRDPYIFGQGFASGHLQQRAVGLRDVTLAGVRWDPMPKFWAGLDGWFAWNILEGISFESNATPPSPFQFVVEPKLGLLLGKLRPSVGFIYPLGGRLADSGIAGARLHVDYAW